jgi:endonuclease/exonuclease/phosphatase family metal-dependent hydrolase
MGTFSLLTLNCFGAPGIRTNARLRQLAQKLNESAYSMVCLQEVQAHRYRSLLANACSASYPEQAYQHFVHAPKGGLLTLSRHEIVEKQFVLFRERGLWYTPAVTDWILHKGILITQIRLADLPVVVLNTHLTANYMADWRYGNMFAKQEHREILQIAAAVNEQPDDALVIVCGDFNIPRGNWMYDMLLESTGLIDPLSGDERPTFRPHRGMGSRFAVAIDFTLFRPPDTIRISANSHLRFQGAERVDGHSLHISDHVGVELTLEWEPAPQPEPRQ